jgi:hypothetical protein
MVSILDQVAGVLGVIVEKLAALIFCRWRIPCPGENAFSFLGADPRLEGACTPGISPTRLHLEI